MGTLSPSPDGAQCCRADCSVTRSGYSATRKRKLKRRGALDEVVEQLLLDRLRHDRVVVVDRTALRSLASKLSLTVGELRQLLDNLARRRMIAVVPFRVNPGSPAHGWEIRLSWAALS